MALHHSYMICATPRSGSTLLCGLLESAGCGRPHSYFRRQSIPEFASRLGLSAAADYGSAEFSLKYLEAVLTEGRGGGNIFGLRVMRDTFEELSDRLALIFEKTEDAATRFELAFGSVLYIYLSREDKVAQAVSLLKATQTGLWHVAQDGSELQRTAPRQKPTYDQATVRSLVDDLERQDDAWSQWFLANAIEPVRLTYRALASEPRSSLGIVLARLGLDISKASSVAPRTAKMADRENEEWISRFQNGRN